VRPVDGHELEAIDWMVVPQIIANMEFTLGWLPAWRGQLEVPGGALDRDLTTLRRWARDVLGIARLRPLRRGCAASARAPWR
jgi:hypothetical protein